MGTRAASFLLFVLLLGAAGLGVPAAAGYSQEPDLVAFAQAYTAAWNARDLAAVLGFFAPDAIVRHRSGDVPEAVWNAGQAVLVADDLTTLTDPGRLPPAHGTDYLQGDDLSWARGRAGISALTVGLSRKPR